MTGREVTRQIWVGAGAPLIATIVPQPRTTLVARISASILSMVGLTCLPSILDRATPGVLRAFKRSIPIPASSLREVTQAAGVIPDGSVLGWALVQVQQVLPTRSLVVA